MKERPILFSTPMVKSILDGRKTMTRRVIKPQLERKPEHGYYWYQRDRKMLWHQYTNQDFLNRCPHGQIGDRLWVRETYLERVEFVKDSNGYDEIATPKDPTEVKYFADEPNRKYDLELGDEYVKKPSIYMPRRFSRITLEITGVKAQKLQDITEEDAKAEGVEKCIIGYKSKRGMEQGISTYKQAFEKLWNSLNEKRGFGWALNPWTWAIKFSIIKNNFLDKPKLI